MSKEQPMTEAEAMAAAARKVVDRLYLNTVNGVHWFKSSTDIVDQENLRTLLTTLEPRT